MKRWNGWGDEAITYPVPASAAQFLVRLIGKGDRPRDISLEQAVDLVPESRLPNHRLISTEPATRLKHARGQSFPDWVELRMGQVHTFPDGVAFPETNEDVRELISYALQAGISIIPYGGGTSVVGHIDPIKSKSTVLTLDMSRMNRLLDLDAHSLLATFQTGVTGPDLEAQLRAHGQTLGHFPQSFEYSTLGGWVATRSSGQQSLKYGRIERLFAGGHLETPKGELDLPPFPASAAGPDLRELVLGSEGRIGLLTQATVRVTPLPEREEFHAVFFPDFHQGVEAVRGILAGGLSLSMLRMSTATETRTTLALAGHKSLIAALERLLKIRGLGDEKCLLLLGFSGRPGVVHTNRSESFAITAKYGGVHVGKTFGEQWNKNRFRTPYLRNSLWEMGYGIDTLETAVDWQNTCPMVEQVESAIHGAMNAFGERVHVFTHLSHVYPYGSSVYTTYLFKLAPEPDQTLAWWRAMKTAASRAIVSNGGTISHQHGVGLDHMPYLSSEKGVLGIEAIRAVCRQFDPKGIMNPGKLVA